MRAYRWTILCGLGVVAFVACGTKKDNLEIGGDDAATGTGDDSGVSGSSGSSSGPPGMTFTGTDAGSGIMVAPSDCKAGRYTGTFTGSYSSNLIFGIPLTVTGDVNLTLDQEGDAGTQCMIEGEGFESCSNVFTLSGGTITGVADRAATVADAAVGGFPYYCGLTGTLDCAKRTLVNGWIQCTYCLFPLTDGGTVCSSVGGKFAGPLTADYELSDAGGPPSFGTLASDPGVWNGAEALAGNNGMMPGPDGGPISDYLALDGGYGFLGKFGGSGNWNATLTQ
jgi:hypothetical protein